MSSNYALSACESFSIRHAIGLGVLFLALLFGAAGIGVLLAWQADSGEQLFGHAAAMVAPTQH